MCSGGGVGGVWSGIGAKARTRPGAWAWVGALGKDFGEDLGLGLKQGPWLGLCAFYSRVVSTRALICQTHPWTTVF